MRPVLGVLADVCGLLGFVLIGRASHHDGETLAGVATVAWPFLAGLAIGVVAARAWRRPLAVLPTGLVVWAATVAGGQLLRVISGQGTQPAFIVVSAVFLALFMLGWRVIARLAARAGLPG